MFPKKANPQKETSLVKTVNLPRAIILWKWMVNLEKETHLSEANQERVIRMDMHQNPVFNKRVNLAINIQISRERVIMRIAEVGAC